MRLAIFAICAVAALTACMSMSVIGANMHNMLEVMQ